MASKKLFLALVVSFLSRSASASVVVLDFDGSADNLTAPYLENGITVTPNCHYHLYNDDPGFGGSPYITIDSSGCSGGGLYNPSFPGPPEYQVTPERPFIPLMPAVLWIEAGGAEFSLLNLFSPVAGWRLESSAGGIYNHPNLEPGIVAFGGARWRNLDWLLFLVFDSGAPEVGMDRLRLRIAPEPGSLILISLSLFTAVGFSGIAHRRHRAT